MGRKKLDAVIRMAEEATRALEDDEEVTDPWGRELGADRPPYNPAGEDDPEPQK